MTGGTYIITNIVTGAVYVGSAKSFCARWKAHLWDLRRGRHVNLHLQRSFDKHGEKRFTFQPHETLGEYNRALYFQKENELMERLKSEGKKLYNIAMAQGGWSFHDNATKKRIAAKVSASLLVKNASMSAEERKQRYARWSKDRRYPDEARHKISQTMIGRPKSDETKAKMKAAQALIADSKRESMAKVGRANKGRLPPNTRRVILEDGTTYESLKKAAEHLSMSSSGLLKRMKKHELGRYIDSPDPSKEEEN